MDRLPAEILTKVIRHVANGLEEKSAIHAIGTLRLVSRRIKSLASRFLVPTASVHLSSKSFSEFEELCRHPEFRLGITHVKINTSYYDVGLAEDRSYFVEYCSSELYQTLEYFERGGGNTSKEIWNLPDRLRGINHESWVEDSATLYQKIILEYHTEYKRLLADQDNLRRNNNHIRRLCDALQNLPALEAITLDDHNIEASDTWGALEDENAANNGPAIFLYALGRSSWSGSFTTAFQTKQPLEMLGPLLAQMGDSNIRPRTINLDFSLPVNLVPLKLEEDQRPKVNSLTSKATVINIVFHSWARQGSFAVNNDRSPAEMCALGSVTTALTSTSTLESLRVDLREYPVFYQRPTVSLDQLLPVKAMTWPRLRQLGLHYLPMDLDDVAALVRSQRDGLCLLELTCPYLLTGDWDEAVELFRGLEKLTSVKVRYVRGGRYGDGRTSYKDFPAETAGQYILKELSTNPLQRLPAEVAT